MRREDSPSYVRAEEAFQKAGERAGSLLESESKLTLAFLYQALGNSFDWRPSIIAAELRSMHRELEKQK